MDDNRDWFRPVWEADEDDLLGQPMGPAWARQGLQGPAFLRALAEAEDGLSRLEASAAALGDTLRLGLVARVAFCEAAGWLAHARHGMDPATLALHALGLGDGDSASDEPGINHALALAHSLIRLYALPPWEPLSAPSLAREAFAHLGLGAGLAGYFFGKWQADFGRPEEPPILAALAGACTWRGADASNLSDDADLRAGFVAAALCKQTGRLRTVPLPFWSTPADTPFARDVSATIACLQRIAESCRACSRELGRLTEAYDRCTAQVPRTAGGANTRRVCEVLFRVPIATPKALAAHTDLPLRSVNQILRKLESANLIREATGRKTFRAFLI